MNRRCFVKRCVASLLLLSTLASSVGYAAEANDTPIGKKVRFFVEAGGLLGTETKGMPGYTDAGA